MSSQHVFKGRLKQTKPDASIIGASESLIHRLVSAVNYSRTAFNSPCSSNLNHTRIAAYTHTHTHACMHSHTHTWPHTCVHTHTQTHRPKHTYTGYKEREGKKGKWNVFTWSQLHKEEPCHYLHLRIVFSQTTLGCWLINSWGGGGGLLSGALLCKCV